MRRAGELHTPIRPGPCNPYAMQANQEASMADEPKHAAPTELVQQIVGTAYAKFCAEHRIRPDALVARRFALEVTESGAREFHGIDGAALETLLIANFGGGGETPAS
jgi:hypothetical protein